MLVGQCLAPCRMRSSIDPRFELYPPLAVPFACPTLRDVAQTLDVEALAVGWDKRDHQVRPSGSHHRSNQHIECPPRGERRPTNIRDPIEKADIPWTGVRMRRLSNGARILVGRRSVLAPNALVHRSQVRIVSTVGGAIRLSHPTRRRPNAGR